MMQEPDYIVFRPSEELKGRVSKHYDGYWYDRNQIPMEMQPERPGNWNWGKVHPSGKFETRDDGAVAEIWIIEADKND